jgi:hypothetical protein
MATANDAVMVASAAAARPAWASLAEAARAIQGDEVVARVMADGFLIANRGRPDGDVRERIRDALKRTSQPADPALHASLLAQLEAQADGGGEARRGPSVVDIARSVVAQADGGEPVVLLARAVACLKEADEALAEAGEAVAAAVAQAREAVDWVIFALRRVRGAAGVSRRW